MRAAETGGPGGLALVGDIGGTNARFGLVDPANPSDVREAWTCLCRDHAEAMDAIETYLSSRSLRRRPDDAVIAVAGPVENGAIRFTNMHWTLSETALQAFGFGRARLINDYVALALAAPLFGEGDARTIGPALPGDPHGPMAVVGPGTGFGVGALVRDDRGAETAIATEGGHVSFAPTDDVEVDILRRLAQRYGRVSLERILSGPGLCDLHEALTAFDGQAERLSDPAEITGAAEAGNAACARTLERFCAILGSVAGDFALAYGARGGVFIGGGIPPLILGRLESSAFRSRFEDKGRFRAYLERVPTRVITKPHAALLGAARAAAALGG